MILRLTKWTLLGFFLLFSFLLTAQVSNPVINIELAPEQSCAVEPLAVPVVAELFSSIKKLSFSMQWDPNLLQLVNVSAVHPDLATPNPTIVSNATNGTLTFNMDASSGQTLDAFSTIFTLYFNILGSGNDNLNVDFSNFPLIQLANGNPGGIQQILTPVLNGIEFSATDDTGPVVTCPSNISTFAGSSCGKIISFPDPELVDNCDPNPILISQTHTSGSFFEVDTTTVTFVYQDATGNLGECSFTVAVKDTTLPSINCPLSNNTLLAGSGLCFRVQNLPNPSFFGDNCTYSVSGKLNGATVIINTPANLPVGTNLLEYTVTDASGNTKSCSFNYTVLDNQPPVFTSCPTNQNVFTTSGVCTATATWVVPIATDNCVTNPIISSNYASGFAFPAGSTTVNYFAEANGLKDTCTFIVTVQDSIKPNIICPANQVLVAGTDCKATLSPSLSIIQAVSDNCSVGLIAATPNLPAVLNMGANTITYTVTDNSGNSKTCVFIATVTDNANPTLSCPVVAPVVASANCLAIVEVPNATATDCSAFTISNNHPSTTYPTGSTIVIFTAIDSASNSATCATIVIVEDNSAPVFTYCPPNISVGVSSTTCSSIAGWVFPTATDCADAPIIPTLLAPIPALFPLGSNNVVYVATDDSGNTATCAFTVSVLDSIAPVWSACPAYVTLNANASTCGANHSWIAPTATDNCNGTDLNISGPALSSGFFTVGYDTISYIATDAGGNSASCTFVVLVLDTIAPSFSVCPPDITTPFVATTDCGFSLAVPQAIPAGNCGDVLTNNLPENGVFPIGSSTIIFTLTDPNTNLSTVCSYNIAIVDNTAPQIGNCPANQTLIAGADCAAAAAWAELFIIESCSLPVTTNSTVPLGTALQLGGHGVVITVTDASGNSSQCIFNINVTDETEPVFENCPSTLSLEVGDSCKAIYNQPILTLTDNCNDIASILISSTIEDGSELLLGSYTATITATDVSDNVATCVIAIEVVDLTEPTISNCPENTIIFVDSDCQVTPSWIPPTATDNCMLQPTLTSNVEPATEALSVGDSLVVLYTSLDEAGNMAAPCTFSIVAEDNSPPVFNSFETAYLNANGTVFSDPSGLIISASPINCDSMIVFYNIGALATDNCSEVLENTQTSGPQSGGIFLAGINNVQFSASDASGNTAQLIVPIIIISTPEEVPILIDTVLCNGNSITLNTGLSPIGLVYNWNGPNGFTSTETNPEVQITSAAAGVYSVVVTDLAACTGSGSLSVVAVDVPEANTTTADIPCLGGNLSLVASANIEDLDYTWTAPNGNISQGATFENLTATPADAGIYTVIACHQGFCCDTAFTTVGVLSVLPAVQIAIADSSICLGQSVEVAATVTPGATVQWTATPSETAGLTGISDSSQISLTPTASGNYTLTVLTTLSNCASVPTEKVFTVNTPEPLTFGTNNLEACETVGSSFELNITNPGVIAVAWTSPTGETSSSNPFIISVLDQFQTGDYAVTATDVNGCTSTSVVPVNYGIAPDAPLVFYSGAFIVNPEAGQPGQPDVFGCAGADLTLNASNQPENTYLWTGPNVNSSDVSLEIADFGENESGIYSLYASQNGCVSAPTNVLLSFVPPAEAIDDQFTIPAQNASTILYCAPNDIVPPGFNVTWVPLTQPANGQIEGQDTPGNFNLIQDTTFGGIVTFTYKICSDICPEICDEATVSIEQVIPCIVPNIITPNSDGMNDALVLGCLQLDGRYPQNEMHLYNEWGDLVFEATPYLNNWSGTNKGDQPLPDGTYFYIFRESAASEWKKGFVTVLRGE